MRARRGRDHTPSIDTLAPDLKSLSSRRGPSNAVVQNPSSMISAVFRTRPRTCRCRYVAWLFHGDAPSEEQRQDGEEGQHGQRVA